MRVIQTKYAEPDIYKPSKQVKEVKASDIIPDKPVDATPAPVKKIKLINVLLITGFVGVIIYIATRKVKTNG